MIAAVFPGQGAQKVGMGKALAGSFAVCREAFAEADAALGESLSGLCFEGPADRLLLTEHTQPAILAMSVAVWRLAASRGLRLSFAAGHSLGEYSAHVAAGTLSFADALRTVEVNGLPVKDFATQAGISTNNAGVRVFRAREALRKQVIRSCGTCADHGCLNCTCAPSISGCGHAPGDAGQ